MHLQNLEVTEKGREGIEIPFLCRVPTGPTYVHNLTYFCTALIKKLADFKPLYLHGLNIVNETFLAPKPQWKCCPNAYCYS